MTVITIPVLNWPISVIHDVIEVSTVQCFLYKLI